MVDNSNGNWIIDLIFFLIFGLGWLFSQVRKARGKSELAPEDRFESPASQAKALPAEARELIAKAAGDPRLAAKGEGGPNPFAGDPVREPIYNELKLRDSESLLQEWYEDDPARWSDQAFEVIQRILIDRLGQLPSRNEEAETPEDEEPVLEPDDDIDSRIRQLWLDGDLDGLAQALKQDPDWLVRMDAAEGLAAWGDARGYDYLVNALGDPADDVRAVAGDILAVLPPAPGTTIAASTEAAPYLETASEKAAIPAQPAGPDQEPAISPGDVWAAYARKQDAFEREQAANDPLARLPAPTSMEALVGRSLDARESGLLRARIVAGAIGGALGFLGFSLLLYLLAARLESDFPGIRFVQQSQFWLMPVDLVVGAVGGIIGDLLRQSLVIGQSLDQPEKTVGSSLWPALGGLAGAGMLDVLLVALASLG